MAKKGGGFRLDLGEPLAQRLAAYCEANFRSKTELIRQILKTFLEEQDTKKKQRAKD
jgi:metal-responsive CopG/Arc/MetJ family transcriptional regulator